MRVLMVSDDFLPNPGGIAAHVYELSNALAELGAEVDIVAGHNRIHSRPLEMPFHDNVTIIRNRAFSWNVFGYSRTALDSAWTIRKALAFKHYDLVHWHSLIWETEAIRLSAANVPRVFTNHSSGFLRRMNISWRRKYQLPRILASADAILAPSEELYARSLDAGADPEWTTEVPNGVNGKLFCPGKPSPELTKKFSLRDDEFRLVVPRRLDPKNGVDLLIRALPEVRERTSRKVRVFLIGDGDERENLEQIIAKDGTAEHVVFCESQARAQMPDFLRVGHVGVLPSRKEAISLAGLEMMATAMPLIGTRVGGIPEFLDAPRAGRLVEPENPSSIAQAIIELESLSAEELAEIGKAAREHVEHNFSWLASARKTLSFYERVVQRS